MEIIISENPAEASAKAAEAVKMQILAKRSSVLGLATGGTVMGLYGKLAEMCGRGEVSFKKVSTFLNIRSAILLVSSFTNFSPVMFSNNSM